MLVLFLKYNIYLHKNGTLENYTLIAILLKPIVVEFIEIYSNFLQKNIT